MGTLYVQQMTDLDATPLVKTNPLERGGKQYSDIATILPVNASATAGTVYAFFRVPARARINGIRMWNTTMTTGAGDWGAYRVTSLGGAAVDLDALAINITLTAQTGGYADSASPGAANDAAARAQPLWQALDTVATGAGLTEALSDKEYDICFTLSTTIGTETQMTAELLYVLPQ